MFFVKVGNAAINLDNITSADWDEPTKVLCLAFMGNTEEAVFYTDEAEAIWNYISKISSDLEAK